MSYISQAQDALGPRGLSHLVRGRVSFAVSLLLCCADQSPALVFVSPVTRYAAFYMMGSLGFHLRCPGSWAVSPSSYRDSGHPPCPLTCCVTLTFSESQFPHQQNKEMRGDDEMRSSIVFVLIQQLLMLSTYYVPGIVLGSVDIATNNTDKIQS